MEIPGAVISASTSIGRSLVWIFHMSWAATDISDWLVQLPPALYMHHSRRSVFIRAVKQLIFLIMLIVQLIILIAR